MINTGSRFTMIVPIPIPDFKAPDEITIGKNICLKVNHPPESFDKCIVSLGDRIIYNSGLVNGILCFIADTEVPDG